MIQVDILDEIVSLIPTFNVTRSGITRTWVIRKTVGNGTLFEQGL